MDRLPTGTFPYFTDMTNKKILIFSVNLKQIDVLKEVAKQLDVRVKTHFIASMDRVVDKLMTNHRDLPDLMLFYVPYPTIDVLTALRKLKADARYNSVPKILLSGVYDETNVNVYALAGIEHCFIMPHTPSAIKALMSQILTNY
jgi:CheY-like chemotaxis protein